MDMKWLVKGLLRKAFAFSSFIWVWAKKSESHLLSATESNMTLGKSNSVYISLIYEIEKYENCNLLEFYEYKVSAY